jgi:stalled ribosome rescue protein Dom34
MKKEIGLWVDHRQAVIVALTDSGEQITRIRSDAEKQIRFAGGSRKDGLQTTESIRGKKLDSRLAKYFDDILAHIRDAEMIQIFGPGDAKNELAKHLEKEGLKDRIVAVETMDNMTDNQISAKVRERFPVKN